MRIFITGINGQLGRSLKEHFERKNEVYGCGRTNSEMKNYIQCDICDYESIKKIKEINPDVIIHCAAYTQVDKAEIEKEISQNINVNGTYNITRIAREMNAKLIYISTDYVFGDLQKYPMKEEDITFPLSQYGITKLKGEEYVNTYSKSFILRVSWIYGKYGNNFVKTMLSLKNKERISVVNDQIGRPTNIDDLCELILKISSSNEYGTYNISNEGEYISWYDFAKEILKNEKVEVSPISTQDYYLTKKDFANRPKNSKFCTNKVKEVFGGLPHWKTSLKKFLKEIK